MAQQASQGTPLLYRTPQAVRLEEDGEEVLRP